MKKIKKLSEAEMFWLADAQNKFNTASLELNRRSRALGIALEKHPIIHPDGTIVYKEEVDG